MENKYVLFGIIAAVLLISFMRPPAAASQDLTICQDFEFKVNVNAVPSTIDFYTEGELFKTVILNNNYISTLLHCGHTYEVIYKSEGYEDYREVFVVNQAMPINPEARSINLIKGGAN